MSAQSKQPRAAASIDPKSTAGILLREHDNAEQALRYAERKSTFLGNLGHSAAGDYDLAAQQLRTFIGSRAGGQPNASTCVRGAR